MPVNIHGKEYKTVAERVEEFRTNKANDNFAIVTEIVSNDEEYVIMKACIRNGDDRIIATGYAQEKYGSSNINKTSALENCETSAIGRALANFGLGGAEFASANEVVNKIDQQTRGENYTPRSTLTAKATDKQKVMIRDLYVSNGGDAEMLEDFITKEGYNPKSLTTREASDLIERLMKGA